MTMLPAGLLQSMVALHDVLFLLGGVDGEALQAAIAKVRAFCPSSCRRRESVASSRMFVCVHPVSECRCASSGGGRSVAGRSTWWRRPCPTSSPAPSRRTHGAWLVCRVSCKLKRPTPID